MLHSGKFVVHKALQKIIFFSLDETGCSSVFQVGFCGSVTVQYIIAFFPSILMLSYSSFSTWKFFEAALPWWKEILICRELICKVLLAHTLNFCCGCFKMFKGLFPIAVLTAWMGSKFLILSGHQSLFPESGKCCKCNRQKLCPFPVLFFGFYMFSMQYVFVQA